MQSRNYVFIAAIAAVGVLFLGAARSRAADRASLPQESTGFHRSIRVSGTAVVYGKPDYAQIELGVSKLSAKVMESKAACDQAMQRVQDAIRKSGVAQEDIQTASYQIFPVQAAGKPNAPRQWKVAHHITVKVRKVSSVAAVLDAAVANGATDVSQVEFGIEKILDLRTKARAEAARVAHQKAEELARLNNVTLGTVASINDTSYEGGYMYAQSANSSMDNTYIGASTPPNVLSGGQIAVNAREDVEYYIG